MNPQRKLGRYSAEAVTLDNRPIILGGMVYDEKNGHKVMQIITTIWIKQLYLITVQFLCQYGHACMSVWNYLSFS